MLDVKCCMLNEVTSIFRLNFVNLLRFIDFRSSGVGRQGSDVGSRSSVKPLLQNKPSAKRIINKHTPHSVCVSPRRLKKAYIKRGL